MTKRERVKAAMAGQAADRVPVAFWRHWPGDDQDPVSLAEAALHYQARFDWDFIKLTPSHAYCVEDYGIRHAYRGNPLGIREHLERAVKQPEDWDRLEPLDVRKGAFGRQLECLRMVVDKRPADTPILQTVFNPLAMAFYLSGDESGLVRMRREPERLLRAVAALTETCARFSRAAIAEGADGIFFATRHASYDIMSEDEYRRFGQPGDLAVLQAAKDGWCHIVHLHGQHPMFDLVATYPVTGLNWHDRTAIPSLAEGAKKFPGAVVGGIEQFQVLHYGTPADVEAQARDAIVQTQGKRLIIGAGCTFPITVSERNLLAARKVAWGG